MKEANKTKETNEVQTIIDLARSHEELDNALSDITMYLLSIKRGSRNIVRKYDNPNIDLIFKLIDEIAFKNGKIYVPKKQKNGMKSSDYMIKWIKEMKDEIVEGTPILTIEEGGKSYNSTSGTIHPPRRKAEIQFWLYA